MQQALAPQEKLQFPEKLEDVETRTKWQKKKNTTKNIYSSRRSDRGDTFDSLKENLNITTPEISGVSGMNHTKTTEE